MARLARLNIVNVPQHIIQRGNNRQAIFFHDDDYALYLEKLKEYSQKYGVAIHAYILMTNHVHITLDPRNRDRRQQIDARFGALLCALYQSNLQALWDIVGRPL
ncbi:transposase [Magnetovibrio blakemorei]|uniref:transposase n=1 Tax=Magnetovibrio blakemorei TaxID=28181 RepID=UPI001B8C9ACF